MSSLVEILREVPDARSRTVYPLEALLSLCIVGFMCGRTSLSGIARFARERRPEELYALGFKRCLRPAISRFSEVFRDLDKEALEKSFAKVSGKLQGQKGFHHLALDGKRLCGSKTDEKPKGQHLVALFSQQLSGVMGQIEADHEITAAITLLSELDLEGCVVSGDAMFCQREISRLIREKNGHYIFALKGNQKPVKRAVENAFSLEST